MGVAFFKSGQAYKIYAGAAIIILIAVLSYAALNSRSGSVIFKTTHVPRGWTKHDIKYGPSVIAPDKWKFKFNKKNGRVSLKGPKKEFAVIWPLFSRKNINSRAAVLTLKNIAGHIWPAIPWRLPVPESPNSVRLAGFKNGASTIALLTWADTPKGTAMCIFMVSAPSKNFKSSVPVFTRIFKSFTASGPALSKKTARVKYSTWEDTRERAFTLSVPQSWKTEGGAYRYAPLDVRVEVRSISPDNKKMVQIGDANVPIYVIPNQLLNMGGFYEGSFYYPGYGLREMVMHYMPGAEFARYYSYNYMSRICSGIKITGSRDRADISDRINRTYMEYNLPIRLAAGEARFSCIRNGTPSQGYVFAGTFRTSSLWGVKYLYIAFAPSAGGGLNASMKILTHEADTFKENPQWVAMNENIAMSSSKIETEANNKIEKMISNSFNYNNKVMDEIARRRENAILGEVDVVDEQTGEDYKVDSGSNYYWINNGTIVGTDTDAIPNHDINFNRMLLRP